MIGIVIVSHSAKVAEGVKDMAEQMSQGRVTIAAAGGVDDETLGTNAERILAALQQAYSPDGVLVLLDLGSAVMSAQVALEMLPEEQRQVIKLSDAPLVEGAIVAAVEASLGRGLEAVKQAAEAASTMRKIL
ncbi:MAG TPA: PTS-dependent dihydroxyacetone kinase phosphotransferase subunit DhaM [Anaerolineae bacterium]|nr:PTS-dependent dihydroxyacetone kinase phosphotransferase subunit DhaM [Anaerolineae bacterium]HID83993.1 PTS-dependent dihydroxyacetone kinase phosphotransferase subunit DhaM [Anaerolineales bacterium]HIQ09838.1 PTS-dependent dihydroxyacetone kinase phosphotransferase subunit DhaM [Anaerolineaceae bacterium]